MESGVVPKSLNDLELIWSCPGPTLMRTTLELVERGSDRQGARS